MDNIFVCSEAVALTNPCKEGLTQHFRSYANLIQGSGLPSNELSWIWKKHISLDLTVVGD